MKRKFVVVVLGLAALSGCAKQGGDFDIVEAGGKTYILNNVTGETQLIGGLSRTPIKQVQIDGGGAMATVRQWPIASLTDGISIEARTKYRDGEMLYSIVASPFNDRLRQERASFRSPSIYLNLHDSDGFETGETLHLALSAATQIVDANGTARSLMWTGKHKLSVNDYRNTTELSLGWRGFSEPEAADSAAAAANAAAAFE